MGEFQTDMINIKIKALIKLTEKRKVFWLLICPFKKNIASTSLRPPVSNAQPSSQSRISRVKFNTSFSAGLPVQASSYQTILLLPAQPLAIEILEIFDKLCCKMHLQVILKVQSIISCHFV